jgi:hypothetical protein
MNILEKKQEIKTEIDRVEDEKLLEDILAMLHRDDDEIPEWHKSILMEREKKYGDMMKDLKIGMK